MFETKPAGFHSLLFNEHMFFRCFSDAQKPLVSSRREQIKTQSSDHLLECLKWLLTEQNASDINNYLTRQVCSGYLSVPRHGTNLFQSTLIYRAITEWNSLPNHVIITNTRAAFKKRKKKRKKQYEASVNCMNEYSMNRQQMTHFSCWLMFG